MVVAAQRNRNRIALGQTFEFVGESGALLGPSSVSGERKVPVLPAKFLHDPSPFPTANLEAELFSEEWPVGCNNSNTCTGTMRQLYREMSYGQFAVDGTVYPWAELGRDASYYEGLDYIDENGVSRHCNGLCGSARVPEFLRSTLKANAAVPWEQYDNDGPDGVPNSGDDDGYVDFVAFVQPKSGGECGSSSSGIWSHRYSLSKWDGSDFETSRTAIGGQRIRIDDYVIMPALACDNSTMIQIGVFAHEFGHAFGLPDLYDTDGKSAGQGLGNWCLMASGSWGGDGKSPERPSHMSPWAKDYLGWTSVQVVLGNSEIDLSGYEASPTVLKVPISATQYYLISNIRKEGFDSRLPSAGIGVWRVNQSAVNSGLNDNTVNTPAKRGIQLVQADGKEDLEKGLNRGDAGDLFPILPLKRSLESGTSPASVGKVALCSIGDPGDPVRLRVLSGVSLCAGQAPAPALIADPQAQ